MHFSRKIAGAAVAVALAGAGFALAVPAAHAATVCATLSTNNVHHYVSPIHGGQALDAINWGGSGSAAAACTGAVVNDNIKTWVNSHAGAAADFTPVPTTVAGTFQLVYTPGNKVSTTAPLCVSTVLDQKGAYARLRPCAGLAVAVDGGTGLATITAGAGNMWQDFSAVNEGDGFFQLEATQETTPYSLNIKGYGGSGTQVISWTPFGAGFCSDNNPGTPCAENEIFERIPA